MTSAPEIIRIGQLEIRFHLAPEPASGNPAVFESVIPAGAHVPAPHRHLGYDETIYGLQGTCHFTVEGREVALHAGQTLFVPRGSVHSFVNRGPETVRVLVVVTPGVLGPAYFREVAQIVNAALGGPPDRARITEVMRRHGMQAMPVQELAAARA
jgi:quercetin dioxygenase-like cupin family protein